MKLRAIVRSSEKFQARIVMPSEFGIMKKSTELDNIYSGENAQYSTDNYTRLRLKSKSLERR